MTDHNIRTPVHHLEDLDEEIAITITAPLSKPEDTNFILDKKILTFISNPYFLKIKLPHSVFDVPIDKKFDPTSGSYTIKLKKINEVLEALSENNYIEESCKQYNCDKGQPQTCVDKNPEKKEFYGFANKYSNLFGKLAHAFSEVVNLPEPDSTSPETRRELRLNEENEKWNDDHYLADTMETDHLEEIFHFKQPWITSPIQVLNDDMKELLSSCDTLKALELSEENKKLTHLQIIDVLFCYAYDKRINKGDLSVESGWTINKLSATLSWFEVFTNTKDVLIACYRRSLIYPLYRNWHLAELVHADVVNILNLGGPQVTNSLLEVKEIFNESENRYILNKIYINNLCWFSHQMTNNELMELAKEVKDTKIKKYEVNRDLPLLEVAAHLTLEEEAGGSVKDISNIIDEISKLKLKEGETTSSSSSSSYESSDSSQSSDEFD